MSSPFDQFLDQLSDSAKLSANDIRMLHAGLAAERGAALVGDRLVRELLWRRELSADQATAILKGEPHGLEFGHLRLLATVGCGRTGIVFRAEHRLLGRLVAAKLLAPQLVSDIASEKQLHRCAREAARWHHPNITRTFGIDETGGLRWLISECIEGADLARHVAAQGPLPIGAAVDAVIQAAQGLEVALSRGLVHGDVRPSHLMRDASGTVKVLGFGLYTTDPAAGTDEESVLAPERGRLDDAVSIETVAFLAPEQVVSPTHVDERSTIYSLGATLYYLLTGHPPYEADSVVRQILAHRQQPIPSLRSRRADLPASLDRVVQCMLSKQRDDRYSSLAGAIGALEPHRDKRLVARRNDAGRGKPLAPAATKPHAIDNTWEGLEKSATAEAPKRLRQETMTEMSVFSLDSAPKPRRAPKHKTVATAESPRSRTLLLVAALVVCAVLAALLGWMLRDWQGSESTQVLPSKEGQEITRGGLVADCRRHLASLRWAD